MNPKTEVIQIPIEELIPNRFQPRISFDEKALNDLANSIKQHGIIQPLVVRRVKDKYEIVAGERRYKAAQIAGLISVPALVTDVNDESSAEIALVENVQRKDLSSIEEAKSYKNILDNSEMTQDDLAKKMGLSQSSVANKLRLLNLNEEVQQALLEGKISERHARSLLSIDDASIQNKLLRRIIDERLTVKQLDEEIKNIKNPVKDDIVDDVPLVNIDENLEKMKEEATDIVPETTVQNYSTNSDNSDVESNTYVESGKFFNFGLGEKQPETSSEQIDNNEQNSLNNDINSNNSDFYEIEEQNTNNNDDFKNNIIEPLTTIEPSSEKIESSNEIETLDFEPNSNITIFDTAKSEDKPDIATIISELKNTVNKLNTNNSIKISELDLGNSYKIEINIEKKDS